MQTAKVTTVLSWILFNVFIAAAMALDLSLFKPGSETVRMRQALVRAALWILLAGSFAVIVYATQGQIAALEFSTGYVIELSLSTDNLFIFLLIFRYFRLPEGKQFRVLFWGILGAIVMRACIIFTGVGLISRFHWVIYLVGTFLTYSGLRLLVEGGARIDLESNAVVRWVRRVIPIASDYEGGEFFIYRDRLYATPLLLVLIVVEITDLIFAVDSVPAVLSITLNTFIVYTSNIFAILGLRSLFFALSSLMEIFEYLHYGISGILVFAGVKMLISHYYHVPTGSALMLVGGILLVSVIASVCHPDQTHVN